MIVKSFLSAVPQVHVCDGQAMIHKAVVWQQRREEQKTLDYGPKLFVLHRQGQVQNRQITGNKQSGDLTCCSDNLGDGSSQVMEPGCGVEIIFLHGSWKVQNESKLLLKEFP